MILDPLKPITCVWEKLTTLSSMKEEGAVLPPEHDFQLQQIVGSVEAMDQEEVFLVASQILGGGVKILQTLVCLGMLEEVSLRRLLACRELSNATACSYPQVIKHKIIAKRYGFSPDTVRRFYTRYPKYFACNSIFQLF